MIYFPFATSACNLSCSYCGSTPECLEMPVKPVYDVQVLIDKIKADPDAVVVFYGGEPLVNTPFVMRVMDALPDAEFVLQTNCTLLNRFPTSYLRRVRCILASIDGRPQTVDAYRGDGVYDKIMLNLRDVRARGYAGLIVARMACSQKTDIYEDVSHLLQTNLFDSVYWQLDAQWDYPMNVRWGDFEAFLRDSYMPGIQRLYDDFIASARAGKLLQISPFVQLTETAVKNVPCDLRCGAGHRALSIATDGTILCCPVANTERWNQVGKIQEDELQDCLNKVVIQGKCTECDIRWICGGRCLYANQTKLWGDSGFDIVCGTVRQLAALCVGGAAEVRELIARKVIDLKELEFPNERYSIETIP